MRKVWRRGQGRNVEKSKEKGGERMGGGLWRKKPDKEE